MGVSASEIFDFIENRDHYTVERYEVALSEFGSLRRSLRQLVVRLRESGDDEGRSISDQARSLLSKWLTVPVPFDESITDSVDDLFGDPGMIEARWGADILELYEVAVAAARALQSVENPVCGKLREIFRDAFAQNQSFKIYCYRHSRDYFESQAALLGISEFSEMMFLHSVRDYRESEIFDLLVKVGPLRSKGWGAAPDALVSAPRFKKLVVIAWSGCADEPDFGYDPSTVVSGQLGPSDGRRRRSGVPTWNVRVNRVEEDRQEDIVPEVDELQLFRDLSQSGGLKPTRLVQLDQGLGVLYSPNSQILSFDPLPVASEPIANRIPAVTLLEGMYVIHPVLGDVDLGALQAKPGRHSRIWKNKLLEEINADEDGLVRRLRTEGLNLEHLDGRVKSWLRPAGTVIHGPQTRGHFRILLRVLGLDETAGVSPSEPFWKSAWKEISRSRGMAIQTGVLGHELVEEQLIAVLQGLLPDIRDRVGLHESFELVLPPSSGLQGVVLFHPVLGSEDGFNAPENQIGVIQELSTIEQWRD
ncbi:MAG: hypothetical protein DYH05_03960 [Acidobacteria bacterium ACB1]|nr:hypothetical protein [Pyrinomonadaceae bacterium]MCE7961634.1 hypothetical protein [Acidobacteria bacterium ACB1]RIJ96760.1 MAG: hypothetical protein DCC44_00070 [Acidobacteriota bacterium]